MRDDFENFLAEQHSKQYQGYKDNMIEDFERWLENLVIDEWIKYGNEFKKEGG